MEIAMLHDLIKDERGNYYTAVHREGRQLTLVNAAVERSYRVLLEFTDAFREQFAEYEHQFIGKMVMDDLRHDVVFAMREDGHGRLYDLRAVEEAYKVTFLDMIEFYRHPRTAQKEQ